MTIFSLHMWIDEPPWGISPPFTPPYLHLTPNFPLSFLFSFSSCYRPCPSTFRPTCFIGLGEIWNEASARRSQWKKNKCLIKSPHFELLGTFHFIPQNASMSDCSLPYSSQYPTIVVFGERTHKRCLRRELQSASLRKIADLMTQYFIGSGSSSYSHVCLFQNKFLTVLGPFLPISF